jgi:hypothetical protein
MYYYIDRVASSPLTWAFLVATLLISGCNNAPTWQVKGSIPVSDAHIEF